MLGAANPVFTVARIAPMIWGYSPGLGFSGTETSFAIATWASESLFFYSAAAAPPWFRRGYLGLPGWGVQLFHSMKPPPTE